MDVLDRHAAATEDLERGPELKERAQFLPAFLAGNRLSEALEAAEATFTSARVADLIEYFMQHKGAGIGHPVAIELRIAMRLFRQCVEPHIFAARMNARISNLRLP